MERICGWGAVLACCVCLGCGGGDATEPTDPTRPTGGSTGGEEGTGTERSGAVVCEQAVRCCYAFVAALTENRPEDRSTCIDLEQFPTDGAGAADNCTEMIGGWQQALAEAQRDAPECSG